MRPSAAAAASTAASAAAASAASAASALTIASFSAAAASLASSASLASASALALAASASALALASIVLGGFLAPAWPLTVSVFLLGAANGAFAVGAIGSMMVLASADNRARQGTRMGLWGAAQAIAFGLGGLAIFAVCCQVLGVIRLSELKAMLSRRPRDPVN